MSQKESRRVYIMELIVQGALTTTQAADVLNLSARQVKRYFLDKHAEERVDPWL